MRLNPIRGLVPAAPFVQEVAAVPYDVVDRSEAAAAELKAALAKKDAQIGALEARIAALEKLMGASK